MLRTYIRNVGLIRGNYSVAAIRFISEESNRTRAKGKLRLKQYIEKTKL